MFSLKATRVGTRDATDGTSNTLLVGEEKISLNNDSFRQWMESFCLTSTVRGINHASLSFGYYGQGFGSHHVGGAHFLMADGAVRFIGDTVNITTFNALGTKGTGEVTGEY